MPEEKKSFEKFLQDSGAKLTLKTWLAIYPGLKEQLDRHILRGASPTMLYDWLVTEYQFPLERTSLKRYAVVLKAAS